MIDFFAALYQHDFLRHALLAGILAGIGCGVIGPYVVVKRMTFLAGGIAHTVLAGMGIAYFSGTDPLWGALFSALAAALLIGWISLRRREQEDTLIGALWAMGMALGIIFISRTPGYNVDLMNYLFGNILMVPRGDLYLMAALDAVIILLVLLFYRHFLAVCFDEEFARLRGVRVEFFYLLLLCMIALTVVLLIQVVGLILIIALLTLPAATGAHYTHSLGRMIVLAMGFGIFSTSAGLAFSYTLDLPAGAFIVLTAGGVYLISVFTHALWVKK